MVRLLNMIIILVFITCLVLQYTAGCQFGDGCQFPCHCSGGEICVAETGDCPGGCHNDRVLSAEWRGPGCQIGNLAFGKITSQKGVHDGQHASRAVDGNIENTRDENSCMHTSTDSNIVGWWQVDLADIHIIYEVVIYNREYVERIVEGRLRYTYIYVGNTTSLDPQFLQVCGYVGWYDGLEKIVKVVCPRPMLGRYLTIHRDSDAPDVTVPSILNVCEVVVTGYLYRECDAFHYGPGCLLTCDHCVDACDDVTGQCPTGCVEGYIGLSCREELPHLEVTPVLEIINRETAVFEFSQWSSTMPGSLPVQSYKVQYSITEDVWIDLDTVPHTEDGDNIVMHVDVSLAAVHSFRAIPLAHHEGKLYKGLPSKEAKIGLLPFHISG